MQKDAKIFVAGHQGSVGSALVRRLRQGGYDNVVTRTRQQLDLLDPRAARDFMNDERPEYVFLAADEVGGIYASNHYRADILHRNTLTAVNAIHAAYQAGVPRLMYFGTSSVYPRECPRPIKEEYLLTGALEPTVEAYALGKITGIKLCESYNRQYGTRYVSVIPASLYGPNDDFDPRTSRVLPALLRKMHEARLRRDKYVTVWGTGQVRREFLHVDDLADACVFLMELEASSGVFNVGTGLDITVRGLADMIQGIVGFRGDLRFDASMPDGAPRKLLDVSKLTRFGWKPRRNLRDGIEETYQWYLGQELHRGAA